MSFFLTLKRVIAANFCFKCFMSGLLPDVKNVNEDCVAHFKMRNLCPSTCDLQFLLTGSASDIDKRIKCKQSKCSSLCLDESSCGN